jgi:PadR family transcriptional regulator PadR
MSGVPTGFVEGCTHRGTGIAARSRACQGTAAWQLEETRRHAYGRAILNEVATRLERDVAAGAVQATLERLERKGLVRSTLGSGTPIRDGRARRFYIVSAEGLHELNEARTTHDTIWRGFVRPLKARS